MGKWTHNYTDDVLTAKVSALITGAIRRSALENPGALPPTYNEFVHELDTGDSFTTTMVDILVKEVMERRKRPAGDRRLISEKTAKNLRLLSGSVHGRSSTAASRLTRYPPIRTSTSREPFFVDTDEDDYEFMGDSNPAEGAAMSSSALFDAMQQHRAMSASDSTTAGGSGSIPPPPLVLPPRSGRVSPWTALPATSTNPHTTRTISQPSSLRRSVGTGRTRELPDWPPRRPRIRSATALAPRAAEMVTEPREGAPDSTTTWSTGHRRFFGLNRIRRAAARRGSVGLSEGSGGEDESAVGVSFLGGIDGAGSSSSSAVVAGSSTGVGSEGVPSQPTSWPEGSQIYVSPRPVILRDIEPAPPLRRGGVLPPESMLTQLHMQYLTTEPPSPGPELDLIEAHLLGEPAAYPTPGSVDNEQSA